jgi:hypothetical protein
MISIPIIRRELTSDLVGRHIYLFGAGAATTDILKRLAEAGAQEGTVVLTEHVGARLGAAVLFRPHLAPGAAPLFSVIAALALSDAIGNDRFCVTPLWPDQVAIDGETVARGVIETAPAGDPTGYVILGGEIDVPALEASWPRTIDWNVLVAKFLNALDKWVTAYAARGPAAVRGAVRFSPRATTGAGYNVGDVLHALAR